MSRQFRVVRQATLADAKNPSLLIATTINNLSGEIITSKPQPVYVVKNRTFTETHYSSDAVNDYFEGDVIWRDEEHSQLMEGIGERSDFGFIRMPDSGQQVSMEDTDAVFWYVVEEVHTAEQKEQQKQLLHEIHNQIELRNMADDNIAEMCTRLRETFNYTKPQTDMMVQMMANPQEARDMLDNIEFARTITKMF